MAGKVQVRELHAHHCPGSEPGVSEGVREALSFSLFSGSGREGQSGV